MKRKLEAQRKLEEERKKEEERLRQIRIERGLESESGTDVKGKTLKISCKILKRLSFLTSSLSLLTSLHVILILRIFQEHFSVVFQ